MEKHPSEIKYEAVLDGIDFHLRSRLNQLRSESNEPGSNVDRSDEKIIQLKSEIVRLRVMREEFENVVAGLGTYYSKELCTHEGTKGST